MREKTLFFLSAIVAFVYLFVGIVDLPNYGPNWDESVHFGRGQAILRYLKTGEKDYSKMQDISRRSYYKNDSYAYTFFEEKFREWKFPITGAGHPPLSDLVASFFNVIFYEKLNILGDVESYHLYSIFLSSLLVGYIFYFVTKEYSFFAGTIAMLSFFLYPLFLGESRFNIKDIPQACFYTFTALFFYKGITSNKIRWVFLSALAFSFGFGTKFNILFLSFTLLLWLVISKKFFIRHVKIFLSFLLYPILSISIFFLSWPLLWEDPLKRFIYNFNYYKIVGLQGPTESSYTIFGFNTYAAQWILFTTPLAILLLCFFGILYSLTKGWKEKNKLALFILLLFLVPILRVTVPKAVIYGGIRQIAEYIPAMAILAGIGANYLVQNLKLKMQNYNVKFKIFNFRLQLLTFIFELLIILSFIPITLKIISLHPNESIYFNPIIGGLKGASEKNIPGWGNSLGSTYRQGVNWLNKHAEKNAKLAFVYELRSNIAIPDLRNDIELNNQARSLSDRKGEYIIGVTHYGAHNDSIHRKYLERLLYPVYEVNVDGVPVLKVWHNDVAHTLPQYKNLKVKRDGILFKKEDHSLVVDLGEIFTLVKIEIQYDDQDCTKPQSGHFEYSAYGGKWREADNNFSYTLSILTNPQARPGFLRVWVPVERTRFIKVVSSGQRSCLLLRPIDVLVYYVQ